MKILAIDPGPKESGWCLYNAAPGPRGKESPDGCVTASGVMENYALRAKLAEKKIADKLAIEVMQSYGMPVGAETFVACEWIGRFSELWYSEQHLEIIRLTRGNIKLYLCGTPRAKDANVRQAILDLFPAGRGTKKAPGPLYGIKSHAWSALAVAITAAAYIK